MNTLEAIKRQGYADGLMGVKPPRQVWLGSDAFSRAYTDAWMAGSLAATAPEVAPAPAPASIVARFV